MERVSYWSQVKGSSGSTLLPNKEQALDYAANMLMAGYHVNYEGRDYNHYQTQVSYVDRQYVLTQKGQNAV